MQQIQMPKPGDIPIQQGKEILRDFLLKQKNVDVGIVQINTAQDLEKFEKAMTLILPLYNL